EEVFKMKRVSKALFYAVAGALVFQIEPAFSKDPAAGNDPDSMQASANVKEFHVVAIEYQGTKVWVPGTLIVKKGDQVKIHLINNIKPDPKDPNNPNPHGYAIDEYGVKAVVANGKPEMVSFKADKPGLFRIYCQLHPAHIGGQLLVLE